MADMGAGAHLLFDRFRKPHRGNVPVGLDISDLGHGARLITGNQKLPGWDERVAAHKPVIDKPLDLASPSQSDQSASGRYSGKKPEQVTPAESNGLKQKSPASAHLTNFRRAGFPGMIVPLLFIRHLF